MGTLPTYTKLTYVDDITPPAISADNLNKNEAQIDALTVQVNKDQSNIASEYSPSATYAVGNYCLHDGNLYKCTTTITTPEAWNSAHWIQAHIANDVDTAITNITPLANAGSHNLYRGKYLGTAVTDAQYTAISNGTFTDLFVGDYWTIGGVNWVIAGFDYYANCGDTVVLGHHAVIVPATNLYSAKMNDSDVTTGAYVGSVMYTTNLASAKTTISGIFGTHLKTHRIFLQNAMSNGYPSGGIWADSTVDLMSEVMVYGTHHFSSMADGTTIPYEYECEDSQLPLMAQNKASIHTRQDYWLRDAVSAGYFAVVSSYGYCNFFGASGSLGVRPAFCIS
jgi:hypothetical protein